MDDIGNCVAMDGKGGIDMNSVDCNIMESSGALSAEGGNGGTGIGLDGMLCEKR